MNEEQEDVTRNEISGGVVNGPVVQAHSIHGGITFTVQAPPAPGPRVVPDEIPPLTMPFVNRSADLALLDSFVPTDTAGIGLVGLHGLPGVGKTATVSHWAESRRASFPDGQIYIDYAELRTGAAGGDVSEAVRHALVSLGVADSSIPRVLGDRTKLFRSRSGPHRLLVVLDNVSDPAQVTALVPKGRGSAVLVASTGRLGELALDGARFVPLEPLDDDSALRLLASRCGEDVVVSAPEAAGRLVAACGGLPVALHLAAARLIVSPGLTVARLADQLADERTRLAGLTLRERSVSAVLGLTYRDLPDSAALLYRRLGWVPGRSFDLGVAAVAVGRDTCDVVSAMETLRDHGLVESGPDDRWHLHDLVRLHARERAAEEETAEDRAAGVRRIAGHYLLLTVLADRAIRLDRYRTPVLAELDVTAPDPFTGDAAVSPLGWLEAERENILAVLRAASDDSLHTEVWQTAESFTALFLHHRHVTAWKESLELGAAAASAAVVPAAEARLRSLLSRPLTDLGRHDEARRQLDVAIACADVSGLPVLRGSVQEFSGRDWERTNLPRAMDAYRLSAELHAQGGVPRGEALGIYFLGCAQDAGGDPAGALEALHRAHEMFVQVDDPRMAARAALAIGLAHDHLGEPAEAVRELTAAAATLRKLGATHYEAQAHEALADLAEGTGDEPGAVRGHLARALEIYEAAAHPAAEGIRQRLAELDGGPGA